MFYAILTVKSLCLVHNGAFIEKANQENEIGQKNARGKMLYGKHAKEIP